MTESVKNAGSKAAKIVFVTSIVVIVTVLIFFFYSVINLLSYDRIYKGVCAYNTNASDMTKEELISRLKSNYLNEINNVSINLKSDNHSAKHYLYDFDFKYDFEKIADEAYGVGRQGNIVVRIKNILSASFSNIHIYPEIIYDETKVDQAVDDYYDSTFIGVEEFSYIIEDNILHLNSGHDGKKIDKIALKDAIESFLMDRKTVSLTVLPITDKKPDVTADGMAAIVNRDPVNARAQVLGNEVNIIPHQYGHRFDGNVLADAAKRINASEYDRFSISGQVLVPELTDDQVRSRLFQDTLSSCKTGYSTADQINIDRETNLRLSSDKINGKILAPGEIFSFNGTVGERSVANGYKEAYVFAAGKMVEGLGGGICQVSSTLYNAALLANLKIIERVNHMFVVSYVNMGLDATIAYGAIDFRFENTTGWPLRINSYLANNNLHIVFTGTNDNKDVSVSLYSEIISSTPYQTVYIDDPNMGAGETRVLQSGINGYVVNAYKTVRKGGEEPVTTKLSTNNYIPLDQRVARGPVDEPETLVEQAEQDGEESSIDL